MRSYDAVILGGGFAGLCNLCVVRTRSIMRLAKGVEGEWHSLKQYSGESTFGFRLRGSNLESVDSAGFVKITRNDPDARIDTMIYQQLGLSECHFII